MNRNDSAQAMRSLIGDYDLTDSEEEEEETLDKIITNNDVNSTDTANESSDPPKPSNILDKFSDIYSDQSPDIDIEDEDEDITIEYPPRNNRHQDEQENTPAKIKSSENTKRPLVAYDVSIIETPGKSAADVILDDYSQKKYESDDDTSLNRYRSPSESEEDGDDCELPSAPTEKCSASLQNKILSFHIKMVREGIDLNSVIQERKDFRNPSIYEKLVQYCEIDEKGTNYPLHLYNPTIYGPESYYEELAKAQKIEMDRIEKEKKERTKVEFVSGMKKSHMSDTDLKRKSKWDDPKDDGKKRFNCR